jgi:acetylornithine deacetylase/succinyl-diaminopimelate desuccinylase-like protein
MKNLIELYKTNSTYKKGEIGIWEIMRGAIPHYNWFYDDFGNYYGHFEGSTSKCILMAHMDMVYTNGECVEVVKLGDILIGMNRKGVQTSLGADDKNGLYAIIELSKHPSHPDIILFSQEEVGRLGSRYAVKNFPGDFQGKYGLVLDRQGSKEIITKGCMSIYSIGFLSALFQDSNPDWIIAVGRSSDADSVSKLMEVVNLSTGSYNQHQKTEFSRISEIKDTIEAVKRFLDSNPDDNPWDEQCLIHRQDHKQDERIKYNANYR